MSGEDHRLSLSRTGAPRSAVDAFLATAATVPAPSEGRGRLIFALDATMSRQPTWDMATAVQGRMFEAAAASGGLDVQLVYFRGLAECKASRWVSGGAGLGRAMAGIRVAGGHTQLGRVLAHAVAEARRGRVGALVFVGDAFEERIDPVCALAGELAMRGTKAFLFQEGHNPEAARAFGEIARLTGGSHARFDADAPSRLAALLSAAAAYAAGGVAALERQARGPDGAAAEKLLSQLR